MIDDIKDNFMALVDESFQSKGNGDIIIYAIFLEAFALWLGNVTGAL